MYFCCTSLTVFLLILFLVIRNVLFGLRLQLNELTCKCSSWKVMVCFIYSLWRCLPYKLGSHLRVACIYSWSSYPHVCGFFLSCLLISCLVFSLNSYHNSFSCHNNFFSVGLLFHCSCSSNYIFYVRTGWNCAKGRDEALISLQSVSSASVNMCT